MKAFYDSSSQVFDADALRERFLQDGYLYLPRLLDRGILTALRKQIVNICDRCQWLKPGTDPMNVTSWTVPKIESEKEYFEAYYSTQPLQNFRALSRERTLTNVMQTLLGPSAFWHPLSIAHLEFPDNQDWSTPHHQAFPNNQGTAELYASWDDKEELKSYWENKRLNLVPWNDSYRHLPDSNLPDAVKLEIGYNRQREALASKYTAPAGRIN